MLFKKVKKPRRDRQMSLSEIMTILVAFHQNYYRNFKHYYLERICLLAKRISAIAKLSTTDNYCYR